ncbi:hypothetical protein ACH5AO_25095 [Streptomyces sp. NPDC018964]|uniref:hypothetical protein n=1 Tax=unclassified Streptomyces TaxID=2593676 RepID=UPI00379E5951
MPEHTDHDDSVPPGERFRRRRAADVSRAWWNDPANTEKKKVRRQRISEGNRAWWSDPANAAKRLRQKQRVSEANRARWNDHQKVAHRRFWILSWALSGEQAITFAKREGLSALPAWIRAASSIDGLTAEERRLVSRAHAASRRSRGGFDASFTEAELGLLRTGRENAAKAMEPPSS